MAPQPYYADDHCTIYHGDCLEILPEIAADVLVTDPPYGVRHNGGGHRSNRQANPSWDSKPVFVVGDTDTRARDGALAIWGDRDALVFGTWKAPRPAGCRQRLLWLKANMTPVFGSTPWASADEEIYVLGSGWSKPVLARNYLETREARAGAGALSRKYGHPTVKPVDLMVWLLGFTSGVVVDPFMGSGPTLEAAASLGRRAIGIEIEEKYCEAAVKRLRQSVFDFGAVS